MLVLSRKKGQAIEIPELQIVIRVLDAKRSKVQLGIEAPRHYKIERSEQREERFERGEQEDASNASSPSRPREVGSAPSAALETVNCESSETLQQMREELIRLEAEVSAVAELAGARQRGIAQQVAGEAIKRIEALDRSLKLLDRGRRDVSRPLAELVRVRTDVLQQLRQGQVGPLADDPAVDESECAVASSPSADEVHEAALSYTVDRQTLAVPRSVA